MTVDLSNLPNKQTLSGSEQVFFNDNGAPMDASLTVVAKFVADNFLGNGASLSASIAATAKQYADASAAARDQSVAAWQAGSAPSERLSGMTQATHIGNVVRSLVADTSRDSDGGAWRKRCSAESYFNERLCGNWLGIQPSEAVARLYGATLGAELFPQPALSAATGLSVGAGWSLSGGVAVAVTAAGAVGDASNYAAYTNAKRYRVSVEITQASGGYIQLYLRGAAISVAANVNAVGVYVFEGAAGTSTTEGLSVLGIGFTGTIDNVSVKEVVSTNRVGTVNYAPSSNDLTSAQWATTNASRSASSVAYGGRTFTLLTENTGNANHGLVGQSWPSILNLKTVAVSIPVKPNGRTKFHVWIDNGSGVGVTVGFDTVALTAAFTRQNSGFAAVGLPKIADVGGGIFMCSFVAQNTSAPSGNWGQIRVFLDNGAGVSDTFGSFTYTGDGVSGMHIGAPMLEIGNAVSGGYAATVGNTPACAPGGDYYMNGADGKYYSIGALGGQVEVFRGNAKEFPAIPDFKAEANRLVVYDLAQPGAPMWGVYRAINGAMWWRTNATISSLAYSNGLLTVGASNDGTRILNFANDSMGIGNQFVTTAPVGGIAAANLVNGAPWAGSRTYALVNNSVNDVAMTVLPDAPVDAFTGLPVPTVAVATAGGVSVVKHDGAVVNSSDVFPHDRVLFDYRFNLFSSYFGHTQVYPVGTYLSAGFVPLGLYSFNATSANFLNGPFGVLSLAAERGGGSFGLALRKTNFSDVTKSMQALVTTTQPPAWQPGDSRLLTCCDTLAEVIGAPELTTNCSPIASATGWGTTNAMGIAYSAGAITATNSSAVYGRFTTPTFPVVAGKTYSVRMSVSASSQRALTSIAMWDGSAVVSNQTGSVGIGQTVSFDLVPTVTGSVSIRAEIASLVVGESATITGVSVRQEELFGNSEFATNIAGVTDASTAGGSLAWDASGALKLNATAGQAAIGRIDSVTLVAGKTYKVTAKNSGASPINVYGGSVSGSPSFFNLGIPAGQTMSADFLATSSAVFGSVATNGVTSLLDQYSIKQVEADRSVKNNGVNIVGQLTKSAVAAGAQLMGYTGFTASNYLEQPYSANLDFGTGDFCVMGWVNLTGTASQFLVDRGTLTGGRFAIGVSAGLWYLVCHSTGTITATTATATTGLAFVCLSRVAGVLKLYLNSSEVYSAANTQNITNASALLRVGTQLDGTGPAQGVLSLWRISATAPSADQIRQIYQDELALFQPGAQCTLRGASNYVRDLAYDDTTNHTHLLTSWGRTTYNGFTVVDSMETTMGTPQSISGVNGIISSGGSTTGRVHMPALTLREELRRKEESRRALGQVPVTFDFDVISFTSPTTSGSKALTGSSVSGTPYIGMGVTGTGIPAGTYLDSVNGVNYTMNNAATVTNAGAVTIGQNTFTLQQGFTAKAAYVNEALKREGVGKTYTRTSSGYRETLVFGASPGVGAWLSVLAIRR